MQGIVITSAHMAKGLEFDEVIIPQVDERNYHSEIQLAFAPYVVMLLAVQSIIYLKRKHY